jgi:hypothetical protein
MAAKKVISAAEFDALFDAGEDISEYVDWDRSYRPGHEQLIEVALPNAVVEQLDDVAAREGLSRKALLNRLISQSLPKAA